MEKKFRINVGGQDATSPDKLTKIEITEGWEQGPDTISLIVRKNKIDPWKNSILWICEGDGQPQLTINAISEDFNKVIETFFYHEDGQREILVSDDSKREVLPDDEKLIILQKKVKLQKMGFFKESDLPAHINFSAAVYSLMQLFDNNCFEAGMYKVALTEGSGAIS